MDGGTVAVARVVTSNTQFTVDRPVQPRVSSHSEVRCSGTARGGRNLWAPAPPTELMSEVGMRSSQASPYEVLALLPFADVGACTGTAPSRLGAGSAAATPKSSKRPTVRPTTASASRRVMGSRSTLARPFSSARVHRALGAVQVQFQHCTTNATRTGEGKGASSLSCTLRQF